MSTPFIKTPALFGWAGQDSANRAYDLIGDQFPHFFIAAQTTPTDRRRVVLWDAAKKVNSGHHLPTFRQAVGDCVSQGAANAIDYLSCVQIIQGTAQKYRPAYQPYIYGISRHQVGQDQLGPDRDGQHGGSNGIWAANGMKQYGVLWSDYDGVPPYSGQVAVRWGNSGPPDPFVKYASQFKLGNAARVTNYTQVRDALANWYPVTVASHRGFAMKLRQDRGRSWGVPQGQWQHQMVFIGVDDDPARPGVYCLNSWGEDAFGPPADDAPPGGFWIDAEVVDEMAGVGDSWALSQFEGYPEQKLDFMLIGNQAAAQDGDPSNLLIGPQKLELRPHRAPLYRGRKPVKRPDEKVARKRGRSRK